MAAYRINHMSYCCSARSILYSAFRTRILISRAFSELSTGNKEEAVVEQSKNESVEKAVEPWMNEEVEYFFRGRSRLAAAMDSSAHDMSEDEVKSALKYLLPSKLTASDARPFLKHPFDIYPKRKETLFSKDRPLEAGFYTGSPSFANILHAIYSYYLDATSGTPSKRKTEDLDLMSKKMRWIRKEEMEDLIQESLTLSQHEHLINILKKVEEHLGTTHSSFLDQFRKPITPFAAQPTLQQSHGNALSTAVGKRKSAVAYVKLEKGSGIITVNGKTFIDYFRRVQDREQIVYPFVVVNQLGKYDVAAHVHGGGISGQTGAIRHGISKALLPLSDVYSEMITKERLLIRDPRTVERKKPGQKKARKKFAWVKR